MDCRLPACTKSGWYQQALCPLPFGLRKACHARRADIVPHKRNIMAATATAPTQAPPALCAHAAQDDDDLYAPLPLSEVDENIGKIVPPAEKKPAAPEGSEVTCRTTFTCDKNVSAGRDPLTTNSVGCCSHLSSRCGQAASMQRA